MESIMNNMPTLEQDILAVLKTHTYKTDIEMLPEIMKLVDNHRPKPSTFSRYYLHGCAIGREPSFLDTELNTESALSTAKGYLKMFTRYESITISTLDESYHEVVRREA